MSLATPAGEPPRTFPLMDGEWEGTNTCEECGVPIRYPEAFCTICEVAQEDERRKLEAEAEKALIKSIFDRAAEHDMCDVDIDVAFSLGIAAFLKAKELGAKFHHED